MANVLSKFRTLEEHRRTNFSSEIIRYLPNGLITGLDDKTPFCEISVSNTKDSLPMLTKQDLAEFEFAISNIKVSGHSQNDALSKLNATIIKMKTQIEAIPTEFAHILDSSLLASGPRQSVKDNVLQITNENPPRSRVGSVGKDGDQLKVYETRIKSLELLLQEKYSKHLQSPTISNQDQENQELKRLLALERNANLELRALVKSLDHEKEIKTAEYNDLQGLYQCALSEIQINHDLKAQIQVFRMHLQSCSNVLRLNFDQIEGNMEKQVRQVEDEIISLMALVANMTLAGSSTTSTATSGGIVTTVASEMVSLFTRVEELEVLVNSGDAQLTAAQADAAIVEAELISVRKLLQKANLDLTKLTELHNKEILAKSLTKELEELTMQFKQSENVCNLLQIQLGKSNELLDDLCIITKIVLEHLISYFECVFKISSQLTPLLVTTENINCDFGKLQVMDTELVDGQDYDNFFHRISSFSRSLYDRMGNLGNILDPAKCINGIKGKYEAIAIDSHLRIEYLKNHFLAFQNFEIDHLILFIPNKSQQWEAFNFNTPNYYLLMDSNPSFAAQFKYVIYFNCRAKERIMAYVTKITFVTAGSSDPCAVKNGTQYYQCACRPFHIEPVK